MNHYKTIKDCAVELICKDGDKLTNKQIAGQVRTLMNSETTDKSIAWYKNKINRGLIKVDKSSCAWLKKSESKRINEIVVDIIEDEIIANEAERYVYELEKKRTGKYPIKMKSNKGPGYDFDSGDRHIEVKGAKKKNKRSLGLTANETDALIKDPKFFLYLVEGNFESDSEDIEVYIIPKNELLEMAQMKIQARLTQLSNKSRRIGWKYSI